MRGWREEGCGRGGVPEGGFGAGGGGSQELAASGRETDRTTHVLIYALG